MRLCLLANNLLLIGKHVNELQLSRSKLAEETLSQVFSNDICFIIQKVIETGLSLNQAQTLWRYPMRGVRAHGVYAILGLIGIRDFLKIYVLFIAEKICLFHIFVESLLHGGVVVFK